MGSKFPTSVEEIIMAIELDAPEIYTTLLDQYITRMQSNEVYPSIQELIGELDSYNGTNHNVHWLSGRGSILRELCTIQEGNDIATFLNVMTRIHYGYTMIRCELCDQPHRMYCEGEVLKPGSQTTHCSCGQHLDSDHPDLFS